MPVVYISFRRTNKNESHHCTKSHASYNVTCSGTTLGASSVYPTFPMGIHEGLTGAPSNYNGVTRALPPLYGVTRALPPLCSVTRALPPLYGVTRTLLLCMVSPEHSLLCMVSPEHSFLCIVSPEHSLLCMVSPEHFPSPQGVTAQQKEADVKALEARLKASEHSVEVITSLSTPQLQPPLSASRTITKSSSHHVIPQGLPPCYTTQSLPALKMASTATRAVRCQVQSRADQDLHHTEGERCLCYVLCLYYIHV